MCHARGRVNTNADTNATDASTPPMANAVDVCSGHPFLWVLSPSSLSLSLSLPLPSLPLSLPLTSLPLPSLSLSLPLPSLPLSLSLHVPPKLSSCACRISVRTLEALLGAKREGTERENSQSSCPLKRSAPRSRSELRLLG